MDTTAIFFTIWRLHKHNWRHFYDPWEAAWKRLVSFLRPLGGRMETTGVISTTIWRSREHDWCHFYVH